MLRSNESGSSGLDFALKRLTKDWNEINKYPLETVYAAPLENDMFTWYANLLAPKDSKYHGIILHLRMDFPKDYPNNPPKVVLLSYLKHHHVFSTWICLDMLGTHYSNEPYSGWSTCYTTLSILLQLQSFLLEEENHTPKENILKAIESAYNFKDAAPAKGKPIHSPSQGKIWPCSPLWNAEELVSLCKESMKPKPVNVIESKPKIVVKATLIKERTKIVSEVDKQQEKLAQLTLNDKKEEEVKQPVLLLTKQENEKKENNIVTASSTSTTLVEPKKEEEEVKKQTKKSSTSKKKNKKNRRKNRGKQIEEEEEEEEQQQAIVVVKKTSALLELPHEILLSILSYLTPQELKSVQKVCSVLHNLAGSHHLWTAKELICFYSKDSFEDTPLGIGIDVQARPDKSIVGLATPLDLLSYNSFYKLIVRKGVWNAPITYWIPLFINKKHAKENLLKESVLKLYLQHSSDFHTVGKLTEKLFDTIYPELAMELMCKLMNTMIVEIMKGITHASIKALHGYCFFHRWLIYLVEKYPKLLTKLEKQFLVKLSVLGPSGLNWDLVKTSVVQETLIRNVLWIIKKHPFLAQSKNISMKSRVENSWEASEVSAKLIMFQVFFLRNVVEKHSTMTLEEIGHNYDLSYGCPEPKLENILQQEIFKIKQVTDFSKYFKYVGIDKQYSTTNEIGMLLEKCVVESRKARFEIAELSETTILKQLYSV
ncbi:hypothetical protein ABK040_016262 [Willaertia magna]